MSQETLTTLNIKVKESSTDAKGSLDKLIRRLEKLQEVLSGGFSTTGFEQSMDKIATKTREISSNVDSASSTVTRSGTSQVIQDVETKVETLSTKVGELKGNIDGAKSSTEGAKKEQKDFGKETEKTTSKLTKFLDSIKRIAMYRLIRTALKEIVAGVKEGIDNMYNWSAISNGSFAKSMDTIATSMLYLRNSLGAAISPIIEDLAPIIDKLVDYVVEALNYVNQAINIISGNDTWTRAIKKRTTYTDKAAESQAELNNQLMGFDELNVITTNTKSGGSISSDYDGMFETVKVDASKTNKTIMDIAGNLKEILNDYIIPIKDNVVTIASKLWEKIQPATEKIFKESWDTLKAVLDGIEKLTGYIADNFDEIYETTKIVFDWVGKLVPQISSAKDSADLLGESFRGIPDFIKDIEDTINLVFGGEWKPIEEFIAWLPIAFSKLGIAVLEALWDTLINPILEFFNGLKTLFDTLGIDAEWLGFAETVQNDVDGWFQKCYDDLDKTYEKAKEKIYGISNDIDDTFGDGYSFNINGKVTIDTSGAVTSLEKLSKALPSNIKVENYLQGKGKMFDMSMMFADGGFPTQGSMFIAGESGAELVGNIGGRTGVASGDEVTGIREAILDSTDEESTILRQLLQVGTAILNKNNGFGVANASAGRWINDSLNAYRRVTG